MSAEAVTSDECEAGFRLIADELLVDDPVCVPEDPQRVVIGLSASFLHPFQVKPIGAFGLVRDSDNFPDLAPWLNDGITSIDVPYSLEQLTALDPDLMIFGSTYVVDIQTTLPNIAPTLILDSSNNDYFHLQTFHRFLGRVFGQEALVEEQLALYEQRLAELRTAIDAELGSLADVQVSMARFYGEERFTLMSRYGDAGAILDEIGFGRPAAIDYTPEEILEVYGAGPGEGFTGLAALSKERLDLLDGDTLIIVASTGGLDSQQAGGAAIVETLSDDPLWQQLNVVQQDQTHFVPALWLSRSHYYAAHSQLDDLSSIFDVIIPTPNPLSVD